MRIEQVDVYVLKLDTHYRVGGHTQTPDRLPGTDYYFEPQWSQAYSKNTESCLVKVTVNNGLSGWGEAQAPLAPEAPASILVRLFAPAILGRNALASEVLYERLYGMMLVRGHNAGFLLDALAAIDTALWDLRGQVWQAPVCELLGGRFRERLPSYLSGLRKRSVEERIQAAQDCVSAGMTGVKLFTGTASAAFLSELRAVREAIGPEAMLAVDCINACDRAGALRIGSALDELNGGFLEAPVGAEDIEGHVAVGSRLTTRIATGEYLRSVQQLLPWLRAGAIQIAQPDVVRSGVTAARRMAAVAHAFHIPVALHVGVSTGIGMATTWQVAASLPNFLVQEHQFDLFETANRILETPLTAKDGELLVPSGPGLGVRVNEQMVLNHAVEHWVIKADGAKLNQRSES